MTLPFPKNPNLSIATFHVGKASDSLEDMHFENTSVKVGKDRNFVKYLIKFRSDLTKFALKINQCD